MLFILFCHSWILSIVHFLRTCSIKLYALSFKFALLYCLSIKNAKVAIKRVTYLTSLYGGKYAPY